MFATAKIEFSFWSASCVFCFLLSSSFQKYLPFCLQGQRFNCVLLLCGQSTSSSAFQCLISLIEMSVAGNHQRSLHSACNVWSVSGDDEQMKLVKKEAILRSSATDWPMLKSRRVGLQKIETWCRNQMWTCNQEEQTRWKVEEYKIKDDGDFVNLADNKLIF